MAKSSRKVMMIDGRNDPNQGDVQGLKSDEEMLDEVEREIRSELEEYKTRFDDLDAERMKAGLHVEPIIQNTYKSFMRRLDGMLARLCNDDYEHVGEFVREWDKLSANLKAEFADLPHQIQLREDQRLEQEVLEKKLSKSSTSVMMLMLGLIGGPVSGEANTLDDWLSYDDLFDDEDLTGYCATPKSQLSCVENSSDDETVGVERDCGEYRM